MPHSTPSYADIRDTLLRDIKNQLPDADISIDSDYYVRASSVASCAEGIYQHQNWIVRQIFPDTADSDFLRLHARTRSMTPKSATKASGTVLLTGQVGSPVPSDLEVKIGTLSYLTSASGVIGADGTLTIAAIASTAGTASNLAVGVTGSFVSAPSGVSSQVTVVLMTGGTDDETDTELLARLLELIRRPPAGGNKYDYRRWAMSVDGVSAAYVYPLRRGLGTVDVVITSSGALPSAETIAATQSYIDDVRPVTTKNSLVLAPTYKSNTWHIQIKLSGINLSEATALVNSALDDYYNNLTPGETLVRSQVEGLITNITGITDRQVILPAGNVIPTVDATVVEWCRKGAVTVELMA